MNLYTFIESETIENHYGFGFILGSLCIAY